MKKIKKILNLETLFYFYYTNFVENTKMRILLKIYRVNYND